MTNLNMADLAKRCKNFNDYEKNVLIDIASDYKNIIENKKTDSVFLKEKKSAWEKITETYNSVCQTGPRTTKQMHALYDFLKKAARRDQHNDRVETYKTGGGSFTPKLTETGEKIISMLTPQFQPLDSAYDSSSAFFGNGDSFVISVEDLTENESNSNAIDAQNPSTSCPNESHTLPHNSIEANNSPIAQSPSACNSVNSRQRKRKEPPKTASCLEEISSSINKRKEAKTALEMEIHVKKCKLLDLELEMKTEVFQRTKLLMETDQKIKDTELVIRKFEKITKEIEFKITSLKYEQIKNGVKSSDNYSFM